jgi:hypothetical protein
MEEQSPVGKSGLVTTTIPAAGMGEVRVAMGGGTTTYGAYCVVRGVAVPTGTRVKVVELFPPRTVVVVPEVKPSPQDTPGWLGA